MGIYIEAEDEVAGDGGILVGGKVRIVELRDFVEVSQLTEGSKEVISGHGSLTLKEGEPEDLSTLGRQALAYLLGQIVVHDVFEVDFVEVVGPWVKHREALVLYALSAVLLDVFLQEFKLGLVSVDWVAEIILIDGLLRVTDEGADGLDARG